MFALDFVESIGRRVRLDGAMDGKKNLPIVVTETTKRVMIQTADKPLTDLQKSIIREMK